MALTLKMARTEEEVKKAGAATLRNWYNELAQTYNRFLEENIRRCPICGEWTGNPDNTYYRDNRNPSGYFYICKKCVLKMVEGRDGKRGESHESKSSVQRMLYLMDLPYIDDLYENCIVTYAEGNTEQNYADRSPFTVYLQCVKGLGQYRGLSWKDSVFPPEGSDATGDLKKPRKEIVKIFGDGFSTEDLLYLQNQYDDWRARTQVDTKSQETYVTQICLQLLDIYKSRKEGKDVTAKLKTLDTIMASANLQPRQNVDNAASDSLTFGQMIEKWELEEPIPEPDPEFKDVDGMGKLFRTWMAGWLGRAIGLKNIYTDECQKEIDKYTVTKRHEEDEVTSDDIYAKMFGDIGDS